MLQNVRQTFPYLYGQSISFLHLLQTTLLSLNWNICVGHAQGLIVKGSSQFLVHAGNTAMYCKEFKIDTQGMKTQMGKDLGNVILLQDICDICF